MFSEFLTEVLTRSTHKGGAGMSTRPEYYSGRGATTSDLDSSRLIVICIAIEKKHGPLAAKAYTEMVASMPKLAATDFLIALWRLESNGFRMSPEIVGGSNGTYAADRASAMATIFEALGGSRRDETVSIRSAFLRYRGVKEPRRDAVYGPYGYIEYAADDDDDIDMEAE